MSCCTHRLSIYFQTKLHVRLVIAAEEAEEKGNLLFSVADESRIESQVISTH